MALRTRRGLSALSLLGVCDALVVVELVLVRLHELDHVRGDEGVVHVGDYLRARKVALDDPEREREPGRVAEDVRLVVEEALQGVEERPEDLEEHRQELLRLQQPAPRDPHEHDLLLVLEDVDIEPLLRLREDLRAVLRLDWRSTVGG